MKFEMKTTLTTISKDAIYHVSGTNQRQYSDKKNTVLKNTYYDSITDINRFVEKPKPLSLCLRRSEKSTSKMIAYRK